MEKVLKLGLLCSYSEPERRLGIRLVCQILEGEAPLPEVPLATSNAEENILIEILSRNWSMEGSEGSFQCL